MTTPEQPTPPPTAAVSGADLARAMLTDYKATTWAVPGKAAKPKLRPVRRRGTGRDPVGMAGTIHDLSTDPEWAAALAGGNVMDQWAVLCPQFATTVQPVAFDSARGRLDLRPCSHVYAANLRLLGGQVAKQINDKMGRPIVKTIRVMAVGAIDPKTTPDAQQEDAPDVGPIRTRETASSGYHRALQAHRAQRAEEVPVNPFLEAARARQQQALASPVWREPETVFADVVTALEELAADAPDSRAEEVHRAARAATRRNAPRRAFDAA